MRMGIIFAVVGALFASQVLAGDATSIQGTPILAPPSGYPNSSYQPCPNCASLDGLVPVYSSAANGGAGGFYLDKPHLSGGPSAMTAMPGLPVIKSLPGNQWTFLDTAPTLCVQPPLPGPYCYFRGGMAAYPNGGYWNLRDGIITISGHGGTQYDVGVFVGTYQEPHTGFAIQPDMINGGPQQNKYQYVGGGTKTCVGPDWSLCQIRFSANLIYCGANGPSNSGSIGAIACEIRVAVYPHSTFNDNAVMGAGAGSGTPAPGSVGPLPGPGTPQGYTTNYYLEQSRGLGPLQ